MDVAKLSEYTGSAQNVFNYDRNAEFAKAILNAATAPDRAQCPQTSSAGRFAEVNSAASRTQLQRRKDVGNKLDFDLKEFEGQKVTNFSLIRTELRIHGFLYQFTFCAFLPICKLQKRILGRPCLCVRMYVCVFLRVCLCVCLCVFACPGISTRQSSNFQRRDFASGYPGQIPLQNRGMYHLSRTHGPRVREGKSSGGKIDNSGKRKDRKLKF
ncbi:unnamed protein product [Gongylonema pulchrum]|uniref:Ribosomal_L18e/L15P domain-containing protein n=1 Tax=Gongylonema pulchrum TaxID=637853 RepID=A0A183E0V8_9BILA|nr:unnamed protein product [Gongylonema pulchrum]